MQEVQILKNMVVEQGNKMMEMAEPAEPAKMVKSGKDKVSLKVYGQVNRMLLLANDGNDSRLFNADKRHVVHPRGLQRQGQDGWRMVRRHDRRSADGVELVVQGKSAGRREHRQGELQRAQARAVGQEQGGPASSRSARAAPRPTASPRRISRVPA